MYALVDCNNFYASCERVFQPEFVGKPVVILSNNDGCIISRSDEAKALGVKMGAPEFKARAMLKENNIAVFSSNYALYGDLSNRVMKILELFTPNVEVYSIDESFLNFDGVREDGFEEYGMEMKQRIMKWLSIPVCVGFGPSKTLSKMANKIARKYPEQTKGVYVIDTDEKRIKALKWTKIGDVWGIGYRMKKKLEARKILTAFDFIQPQSEAFIKNQMGVVGLRLIGELKGNPVLGMELPETKKSIAITRSFPKQLTDFDSLRERVSTFAMVCGEKLRNQNSCCNTVIVMLGTMDHNAENTRGYYHQSATVPFATNSGMTIANMSVKILEKLYEENKGLRFNKAGVIVTQLTKESEKQFQLFEEENPKHLALMKTIDLINEKAGERKVKLGTQGRVTWNMRQNLLSPRYTTRITDIMKVKCQ
ncbi:DNA polymerase V [Flavobacterium arsenatis]|uniref:DNA polymerase V n=1 Tax=Flavobacterium arsenatis TaxID=1484332 RepID=A0ABU1TL37_9FLAO|nr:Y-family DNA polymerase [Flavobacterium arsenatis]MDR6966689.1 DNA polymerase V [Flavobacterium arsenatis]